VRCLIETAELASQAGCGFVVQHPSAPVLRVLQVCGVDEILLTSSDEHVLEDS
jgi:hypothetical protein